MLDIEVSVCVLLNGNVDSDVDLLGNNCLYTRNHGYFQIIVGTRLIKTYIKHVGVPIYSSLSMQIRIDIIQTPH